MPFSAGWGRTGCGRETAERKAGTPVTGITKAVKSKGLGLGRVGRGRATTIQRTVGGVDGVAMTGGCLRRCNNKGVFPYNRSNLRSGSTKKYCLDVLGLLCGSGRIPLLPSTPEALWRRHDKSERLQHVSRSLPKLSSYIKLLYNFHHNGLCEHGRLLYVLGGGRVTFSHVVFLFIFFICFRSFLD